MTATTTPRTLEEIRAKAVWDPDPCGKEDCGAYQGHDCKNAGGGTHLRRFVAARLHESISDADIGLVFFTACVLDDSTIIPAGDPS
jgi:hypothetical protein